MKNFDIAIVGSGTMGNAAAKYLSESGFQIVLLDPYIGPHIYGSHSGSTRIIRKSYFEHPSYVPLLQRSYALWKKLEYDTGINVYHETGLLYLGDKTSAVIKGVKNSSELYSIPLLSTHQSIFRDINENWETLNEPEAGYLDVKQAFRSFYQSADSNNVFRVNERVNHWQMDNNHILIKTNNQSFYVEKLIFTAGSWTSELLPHLNIPLTVTKQVIAWIKDIRTDLYSEGQFPCWFLQDPYKGMFYGSPINHAIRSDLKIGLHAPGRICNPNAYDRSIPDHDKNQIASFIADQLPELKNNPVEYETCLYTYTPDENFIIDYLPHTNENVIIAAGFSGHGFKFAPVVGEILSEMAMNNKISINIDFLGIQRFTKL